MCIRDRYNHPPNVDAVHWLCAEIMPLVWKEEPDLTVTLLGSNPPQSVLALQSSRVRVPGYVRDVSHYFTAARIFVAPLRYGAGMNGKVGQALSYRLPVVLTEMAADGFALSDGDNCLIANDAGRFARAILRLNGDEALWHRFSNAARNVLAPLQPENVKPALLAVFDQVAGPQTREVTPAGARS